jgi:gliding motility-associated-like protein
MLADSIYSLETRNGECVRFDTLRVTVLAPRPAFFEYAFVGPQTLRFTYTHVPAPMRWLWDFGDGTAADERRPLKTFSPGPHRVTLITLDSLGCRDTFFADLVVPESDVLAVPDAFTPDADDVNREFRVFAQTLSDFQITIWDRYGRAVFVSRDPNFAWRGDDGHRPLPEGVYAYTIKAAASDGKPVFRSGTITLFR